MITGVGVGVSLAWCGALSDASDPAVTPLVELKTADGIFLVTADGNYLGTEN